MSALLHFLRGLVTLDLTSVATVQVDHPIELANRPITPVCPKEDAVGQMQSVWSMESDWGRGGKLSYTCSASSYRSIRSISQRLLCFEMKQRHLIPFYSFGRSRGAEFRHMLQQGSVFLIHLNANKSICLE